MYNSLNLAKMIKLKASLKNVVIKNMLTDLNLGSNTMSNLYHGKSLAFDSLAKIADYLNCSIDELLGRSMPSNNETDNFKETLYRAYNAAPEHIQKTIADILNITDTPTAADDIVTHLS